MPYMFVNIFSTIYHLLILFMCFFPSADVGYFHIPQEKIYENVFFCMGSCTWSALLLQDFICINRIYI